MFVASKWKRTWKCLSLKYGKMWRIKKLADYEMNWSSYESACLCIKINERLVGLYDGSIIQENQKLIIADGTVWFQSQWN